MRLQPTPCAEAPPVSWFKARKSSGGDQVVALSFRKLQKSRIHLNTNGVNTHVLFAGIAAAVSKNPVMGSVLQGESGSPKTFRLAMGFGACIGLATLALD